MLQTNLIRLGIDFAVETDLLYFDVGNGRIGIQTAAPDQALHVVGGATVDNISITTNAITSLNTNGDISISPDGSGLINLSNDVFASGTHTFENSTAAANKQQWLIGPDGDDFRIKGLGTPGTYDMLRVVRGTADPTSADDFNIYSYGLNQFLPTGGLGTESQNIDFTTGLFQFASLEDADPIGVGSGGEAITLEFEFFDLGLSAQTGFLGWNANQLFEIGNQIHGGGMEFSIESTSAGTKIIWASATESDIDFTTIWGSPIGIKGAAGGADAGLYVQSGASLFIDEKTTDLADQAGKGQIWVKDDTPNILNFTDDAGTIFKLNNVSGVDAGDVYKVSTPVNDQVGVWTGDGTLEGTTGLTYSGTVLTVAGTIVPGVNDSTDLGSTSLGWRSSYLTDFQRISDTVPQMRWHQSNGALDQKYWFMDASGESFRGLIYEDALVNNYAWLNVERSGTGASVQADTIDLTSVTDITLTSAATIITGDLDPSVTNTQDQGTSGLRWKTIYSTTFDGTATIAQYADLAEKYEADEEYEVGTVLSFGGDKEVTISNEYLDHRIAGIVSADPAYLMNNAMENGTVVALRGRIPCKVFGKIRKGDLLVSKGDGSACAVEPLEARAGTILGKALENFTGEYGVIEVVV